MKIAYLALAVIFFVIAVNADASVSDFQKTLTFFEEPKTISFEVENNSGSVQELKISVFSPTGYEINGKKNALENGEKTEIKITFFPRKELINSKYEATVLIELGREKTEKKIALNFYKSNKEEPAEAESEKNVFDSIAVTGNVFLAGFGEILDPVNVVLIIIAALLLFLFVSRLVKRLNEGEK
ncbi:MAG: hypothetical protein ABH986_06190 [archaeon]